MGKKQTDPHVDLRPDSRLVISAVVVTYLLARTTQWVLSLPTIVGPDSHSFLPGPGLDAPPNWYFGFEKVSFTGEGVIRPWTITLPYALLGADFVRSFAQMMFSAAAFLFLAWALWRISRPKSAGLALALLILAISLTTLVTSWDMLLNRESIAISLTALLVATALLATFNASWPLYFMVNLVALLLTITRPTIAPLTLGVLAALLVIRFFRREGDSRARRWGGAFLGLGLMAVVLLYPAWFSTRMDASWSKWYGHTMSQTQFGYIVADYNPRAASLKAALKESGAPECLIETLPVYTGEYLGAPWGFAANMRDNCAGFDQWYEANWPTWYYRYIATHPDYVAKLTISGLPLALHPWDNGATTSLLPASVRNLIFPDQAGAEVIAKYDPFFLYWMVVAGMAVTVFVFLRDRLPGWLRRNWAAITMIAVISLGSVASIIINLLLVPSYPLEINRVNVSTALLLRGLGAALAVWLCWNFAYGLRNELSSRKLSMRSVRKDRERDEISG